MTSPKKLFFVFPFSMCCLVCVCVCVVQHFSAGKTTARLLPLAPLIVVSDTRLREDIVCGRNHTLSLFLPLCTCYFSRTRQRELISDVLRSCCSTIFRAIFGGNIPSKGIFSSLNLEIERTHLFLVYKREDLCILFSMLVHLM